eukprot:gene15910-17510_t
MAGEIFAAFRTILLFISLSWFSVMYLVLHRIPRLEEERRATEALQRNSRINEAGNAWLDDRAGDSALDDIQIFGDVEYAKRLNEKGVEKDARGSNPSRQHHVAKHQQVSGGGLQSRYSNTADVPVVFNGGSVQDNSRLRFRDDQKDVSWSFSCRDLSRMQFQGLLGSGFTKTVRKGLLNGRQLAVKYTTERNPDIIKCTRERNASRHFECYNLAKFKLLKEATLLQQLIHPNIIKFYGICPWRFNDVEGSESIMTLITEVGKPLDLIKIIQIPWDDRLKMSLDLIDLMLFFETSPLGALHMKDFRIDQFVLANGKIKLTDLDDIDGRQKQCSSTSECFVGGRTTNKTLPCEDGLCSGYVTMSNLYHLDKVFLDYSLNYDNPEWLKDDLKVISQKVKSFLVGFEGLRAEVQGVVENIKNGVYSRRIVEIGRIKPGLNLNYEVYPDASVFGSSADYYCQQSRTSDSCELAVASIEEAKVLCSMDEMCRAFVVTQRTNWLGETGWYFFLFAVIFNELKTPEHLSKTDRSSKKVFDVSNAYFFACEYRSEANRFEEQWKTSKFCYELQSICAFELSLKLRSSARELMRKFHSMGFELLRERILLDGTELGLVVEDSSFASNLNTSLSAMTSVLISGLIHTANTLGEVIIAAFETTVTKVTGIIDCIFAPLHAVYLLLLQVFSIIVEIPNIVTSLMASLFELLKMAVNAANRLGGSFVDFIIMPFSLKNIAAIFQSLYLLLYASFSLLLSPVYIIFDATHQVIQWICTAAITIGRNFFSVLIQGHLWLAVVIILMTVIMYRQGFSGLKKLPELFRQLFSRGYVRRPNVIEHEFVIEEEPDVFVREERPIVPVEHDEEEPDANVRKDIVTDEQHICIACQENPRDILILPCRHLCLCHNCAEMLPGHQFGRRACPLCRKPIDNTMKVFM